MATPSSTAFIGIGVMGEAILTSVLRTVDPQSVRVADGRIEHARERAAAFGVHAAAHNTEAVDGATVVVLAVKPKDIGAVAEEIAPALAPGAVVVSVAAGISTAFLESRLPAGTAVVRVMPNTPATIGEGVSVLSAGTHATEDHLDQISALLEGTGAVYRVDEPYQDAVTAISGSGPAYVFYLIDALAEAGVLGGLSRDLARDLAVRTVAGAGAMAQQTGEHPVVLREKVSSPAGTTVAAIRELDERGVRAAVIAAAETVRTRSIEMGREHGA
ncbi:pyrroline-5-carboxylate reductase [Ruania halotolerans]|uniref:pyrroline-5-carboxylate reductase n=1 Tax=Ruania halotolerans TaxID=2897773 RepID=UPI001E34B195|nr:pyrroline-5-carboxylate reductase [Ruania halotolerans]UFU05836.1 pyrroline-5-carboxylate reductase [Ruania halotolerans]